jgi:hypothetical protein
VARGKIKVILIYHKSNVDALKNTADINSTNMDVHFNMADSLVEHTKSN